MVPKNIYIKKVPAYQELLSLLEEVLKVLDKYPEHDLEQRIESILKECY